MAVLPCLLGCYYHLFQEQGGPPLKRQAGFIYSELRGHYVEVIEVFLLYGSGQVPRTYHQIRSPVNRNSACEVTARGEAAEN